MKRPGGHQKNTLSGDKGVSILGLQSCQPEGLSRFRDVKGRPDQEKVASSDSSDLDAKRKKTREKEF